MALSYLTSLSRTVAPELDAANLPTPEHQEDEMGAERSLFLSL